MKLFQLVFHFCCREIRSGKVCIRLVANLPNYLKLNICKTKSILASAESQLRWCCWLSKSIIQYSYNTLQEHQADLIYARVSQVSSVWSFTMGIFKEMHFEAYINSEIILHNYILYCTLWTLAVNTQEHYGISIVLLLTSSCAALSGYLGRVNLHWNFSNNLRMTPIFTGSGS